MDKSIFSLASVLFLFLALLGPWFTISITESYEYREDYEEDGQTIVYQDKSSSSYYLDKNIVEYSTEEGPKGFLGVDAETESHSGSYTFYESDIEDTGGVTNHIFGFMHSLYKIFLVILLVRIALLFGEGVLDVDRALLFSSFMIFLLIIFFLFGFKNSYISTYDHVILENDMKGEPDVNMTFIFGFGNNSEPNSQLDYREETTSYRYERFWIGLPEANWIESGSYFYFNSGGNTNMYYVWFDKNGDGITDKPSVESRSEIRVDLSEFNEQQNQSQEDLRDSTYLSLTSEISNSFTIQKQSSSEIVVTATVYGETDNIQNVNVNGLDWNVQENGGVDNYYNEIRTSTDTQARWYPSWGFLLFFLSGILGLVYRDNS